MNYSEKLKELIVETESNFNFNYLKKNYVSSNKAKEFLDKYYGIKNHMLLDDEAKYKDISSLITNLNEIAISTTRDIKEISSLWIPDYDKLKRATRYYEPDLRIRSKIVCESIKKMFEEPKIREKLSNEELYNLNVSYHNLINYINNGVLTNEILQDIENKLTPISAKIWEKAITSPENYIPGKPFMFIVHNIAKTNMDTTELREHSARKGKISTSLITDKEMGVYGGNHKYGFIYPKTSRIITVGFEDLYSYETKEEGEFYQNNNNSPLILPTQIESYCIKETIRVNKKMLNSDNETIYNEVVIDSSEDIKPVGIYCITYGEKELSYDYVSAKKLADKTGLPLIEIDLSLYRTKGNTGTIITDEEALTPNEQREFAERFLKQYYNRKQIDINDKEKFIEVDLKLYQDMIIDIFLTQKKSGDISKEKLFDTFESKKNQRIENAETYNLSINKINYLKEILRNYDNALKKCNDDIIKNRIINEVEEVIQKIETLNAHIELTNDIGLSEDNFILQNNPTVKEAMNGYTPFKKEHIEFNGKKIMIITGYKDTKELEQDKQEILKKVIAKKDPIEKRKEHAIRVVEVMLNGYKTNSTNNHFASSIIKIEELERIKETSSAYAEIFELEKKISSYEGLARAKEKIELQIRQLEQNRRIYSGFSSLEWIEEQRKKCDEKITNINSNISKYQDKLKLLQNKKEELIHKKKEIDKKGFFGRIFSRQVKANIELELRRLETDINVLQININSEKENLKYPKEIYETFLNSFLKQYALEGMTLEQYKRKLEEIIRYKDQFIGMHDQIELEDKLRLIQRKMEDIKITEEQYKQIKIDIAKGKIRIGIKEANEEINNEEVIGYTSSKQR